MLKALWVHDHTTASAKKLWKLSWNHRDAAWKRLPKAT